MAGARFIADEDLDPLLRPLLAQCTTARVGLDGRRYWPLDEVVLEELIALLPADPPSGDPLAEDLL